MFELLLTIIEILVSWISFFSPPLEDFPPNRIHIDYESCIQILSSISLRLQQFKDIPVIKMSLGYKKQDFVQQSKRRHFSSFLEKIELPLSIICVQRSFGYCGYTLLFQSHCSVVDES
jgi:hypothetical protein